MIKVSPYTPLMFPGHTEGYREDGYRQVFATTDRILIQAVGAEGSEVIVRDACTSAIVGRAQFVAYDVNSKDTVYTAEVSGLAEGSYVIGVMGYGESQPFTVTSDKSILDSSVLIQYSMPDNRRTDKALFYIDGVQQFFDFRFIGGFRDADTEFGVDNEQFETPGRDIIEIKATEKMTRTLTVGDCEGCPIWVGELVNRILSCMVLYVDGERMSMTDGHIDKTEVMGGADRFVYTAKMSVTANLDPSEELGYKTLTLRRETEDLRGTDKHLRQVL